MGFPGSLLFWEKKNQDTKNVFLQVFMNVFKTSPKIVYNLSIHMIFLFSGSLITTQPFIQGKALTQQQIAILRQKAAQQQQQQQLQKIQQQQRIQQQKQQQLKLIQQQSTQQAQIQQANQTNKQVQPTIVATSNQLGKLFFH